jgi:hypothetical protein
MNTPVRRVAPLCIVLLLAACAPLFFPPVPASLSAEPTWRIAPGASLALVPDAGGPVALRATWVFTEAGAPGWVSAQWFGPVGAERASDARWVDATTVGSEVVWDSPADMRLTRGRWRMVVSIHDRVLRQLDVDVE